MKFKELEIKKEGNWFKRVVRSPHTRKTIIYTGIGLVAGFVYYMLTKGSNQQDFVVGDMVKSMLFGGFLGFFITNSPCARNKC